MRRTKKHCWLHCWWVGGHHPPLSHHRARIIRMKKAADKLPAGCWAGRPHYPKLTVRGSLAPALPNPPLTEERTQPFRVLVVRKTLAVVPSDAVLNTSFANLRWGPKKL